MSSLGPRGRSQNANGRDVSRGSDRSRCHMLSATGAQLAMDRSKLAIAPSGRATRPIRARWWFKRGLQGAAAFIAVLLLVLAGMFGYLQLESRQAVTLPSPTGHYQVGRTIRDWTDSTRTDPFSPTGRSPVDVSVWVWYPAVVPQGAQRAAYMPADWARALDDFLHTRAAAVSTHSWSSVPIAGTGRRFPVLVFMPGFGRVAADYTTLAEDLASQGYVVFAINPPYISDDVVLDGRLVPENERLHAEEENAPNPKAQGAIDARVIEVEADEMRFVLDRAASLSGAEDGLFAGRLITSRAGFLGHSIGGAAAARACEVDPRCVGAVNLDGDMAGGVVAEGIHKPFLFLGEDPSISPPPTAQLRGVIRGIPAGEAHVLTLAGAGHMNFSDLGVLWKFPPNQLGAIGPIDGRRALTVTQTLLLAFFGLELNGKSSRLLSSPSATYPEVHVVEGVA